MRSTATEVLTSHELAEARAWDLFQHDGFWYVHTARGGARTLGSEKELGSGPSPADALAAAHAKEAARAEATRLAALEAKRQGEQALADTQTPADRSEGAVQ